MTCNDLIKAAVASIIGSFILLIVSLGMWDDCPWITVFCCFVFAFIIVCDTIILHHVNKEVDKS